MAVEDSGADGGNAPLPSLLESALPGILARGKVVVSPYPFATSDDDQLRITVLNSVAGVVVNVHGRLVTRDGAQHPFRYTLTPNSSRSASTADFPLAGGFVSNLSAFASGASPLIGQTFVIVQIIRGANAAAFVLGTLLSSYVTVTQPIGWPGTPIQSSIEGGGVFRTIQGTNPGFGNAITETVPAGARWELRSLSFQATVAAAGALRPITLNINDSGGHLIGGACSPITFLNAVNQVMIFSAAFNAPSNQTQSSTYPCYSSLPYPLVLLAGMTFTVPNPFGTDQWAGPFYEVQEWLEGA